MSARLAPRLAATLVRVAQAMTGAEEHWWVVTGAAAALHGAKGEIADVDLLIGEGDAARLLPTLGLAVAPGAPHPRYRSLVFARWCDPPLGVEFMAGFHLDGAAVVPRTRVPVTVGNATLFVPAREELAVMLRTLGRPKDLARAAFLTS